MEKEVVLTIDELFVLLKSLSSQVCSIKGFVKSESESGAIVDNDDVELVRTLHAICELIESKVELPF